MPFDLPKHPALWVDTLPRLPERPAESHKGMFGHALLVGGARGMTGAITLAGQAALRGGAGLVTLAMPAGCQGWVAPEIPCAMTLGLPETTSGRLSMDAWNPITEFASPGKVLGIGPGLGRCPESDALVAKLFQDWPGPAVFDADALQALAGAEVWRRSLDPAASAPRLAGPRVLTPHPGEWGRLSGAPPSDRAAQIDAAVTFARRLGTIIVLKGHGTIVTDGHRNFRNPTGNPSLAVGGSGDSLTGLIVALGCQQLSPWDASVLGVYLHGLAGDLAHEQLGTPSTLPSDWLQFLPHAFRHVHGTHPPTDA